MAEYLDSYSSSRLGGNLLLPCCPGEMPLQTICSHYCHAVTACTAGYFLGLGANNGGNLFFGTKWYRTARNAVIDIDKLDLANSPADIHHM